MKIDIDGVHSVNHTSGYYNVHVYGVVKTGENKGDKSKLYMKTYADIFGAWDKLKELGVNSNKALECLEKAKDADVLVITKKALQKRKAN
jgi:hypothetical protein